MEQYMVVIAVVSLKCMAYWDIILFMTWDSTIEYCNVSNYTKHTNNGLIVINLQTLVFGWHGHNNKVVLW